MEDLSDVPSRADQAVDRAEYVRLSWEGAKARLEKLVVLCSMEHAPAKVADIRAALERVDEATTVAAQEHDRAEALRQRVEELEEVNAVIPELMRFKWNDEQIRIATERAEAAEVENARLRVDADHEQGLRWLAQMSASEAYAKRDCLLADLSVMKARAERAEAALAAEEEKREQAEGQCEAVSRDCIHLQAKLAAEVEKKHSKHPTGDYCVYCRSQWPCAEAGEGD